MKCRINVYYSLLPGDVVHQALWHGLLGLNKHTEYDTWAAGPHKQKVDFPTDAKLFLE